MDNKSVHGVYHLVTGSFVSHAYVRLLALKVGVFYVSQIVEGIGRV